MDDILIQEALAQTFETTTIRDGDFLKTKITCHPTFGGKCGTAFELNVASLGEQVEWAFFNHHTNYTKAMIRHLYYKLYQKKHGKFPEDSLAGKDYLDGVMSLDLGEKTP